jgi:hypothetical protein
MKVDHSYKKTLSLSPLIIVFNKINYIVYFKQLLFINL